MAFADPNAPIIARMFGTDTSPNPRIEIDSYRAQGVTSGGQIRFYSGSEQDFQTAYLELVSTGLAPDIDEVFTVNGPNRIGPKQGQILLTQYKNGTNEIRLQADNAIVPSITLPGEILNVPAFAAGWTNTNGAFGGTTFYKTPDRYVTIEGACVGGTGGIFTLPVGYRPPQDLGFVVSGNNAFARVTISASTGLVSLVVGTATTGLHFSGIRFRTF